MLGEQFQGRRRFEIENYYREQLKREAGPKEVSRAFVQL